jgi:5-methylcytosine-specific restriction endonuclease McrA
MALTCAKCGLEMSPHSYGMPKAYCSRRCKERAKNARQSSTRAASRQLEAEWRRLGRIRATRHICSVCLSLLSRPLRSRCPRCVADRRQHEGMQHGTESMYTNGRCRCDACKGASRRGRTKRREEQPDLRKAADAKYRQANAMRRRKDAAARTRRKRALRRGGSAQPYDRRTIYQRDGGRCHICGETVDPDRFHLDHLVPIADGGADAPENVAVAHPRCNLRRGRGRTPVQLRLVG